MRYTPNARGRSGFTLIEVMVALVIFNIGLLALAAGAALLVRQGGLVQRLDAARLAAASRVARLRAGGCPATQQGADSAQPGLLERWQVTAPDSVTRAIDDSVEIVVPAEEQASDCTPSSAARP